MDRETRLRRQKEFLIQIAYWAVWGVAAIVALKYIGNVVLPFVLAFLVAWGLSLFVDFATAKLHLRRGLAAVLTVVLFYGILAVLLYLLGSRIVELMQSCAAEVTCFFRDTVIPLLQAINTWVEGVMEDNAQNMNAAAVSRASEMTSGVSAKVFDGMSEVAAYIPGVCMDLFLTVIATMLIELEFPDICAFIARQIPKRWKRSVEELQKYVMGTLGRCALSYCLILLLTFAELTAGLLLLRIEGAVVIAFIIAILDIFPVLGTGTILLPWAVIVSASGNLPLGIGLLLLYLVITVVRNIVEPHLVGKQMGLSPIVTLVSMIVGLHFLGIVGLILLPLGVALIKSLNDSGVIHLFRTAEEENEL